MFDPCAHKDSLSALRGKYHRDHNRLKVALSVASHEANRAVITLRFVGEVTAGDIRSVTECNFTPLYTREEMIRNGLELMSRAGFVKVEALHIPDDVDGSAEFVAQVDSFASRADVTLTELVLHAENIVPDGVIPNPYVHKYGGDCYSPRTMLEQCGNELHFNYPGDDVPDDKPMAVSVVYRFYPKSAVDNFRRALDAFDDLDYPDELLESWERQYARSWCHVDNQAERREMSRKLSEVASEYNAGGDVEDFDEGAKSFVRYY